jgi:hypothetical protein
MTVRPAPTTDLAGLFSATEGHAAGWTDAAIGYAVSAGRWRRVRPGLYVRADADDGLEPVSARPRRLLLRESLAAHRSCARSVISHAGAAVLHGLPLLKTDQACVTVDAGTALRRLASVHLHRAGLPDDQVLAEAERRWTSVPRTVLDLAREHGLEAGVVAADAALRDRLLSAAELRATQEYCGRWPGRRAARLTVLHADASAESPLESISRLRLLGSSLPTPTTQQEILDAEGRLIARVDFYFDELGVFGEADGNLKYALDPQALVKERRRQQALEDLGLVGVRWEWRDLARFEVVEARLLKAARRGLPPGHPDRRWRLPG